MIRNVADEGEPKTVDETPFVADGIAAGAYNEDGVDVTLIRVFLKLTPAERLDEASASANGIEELRALYAATPR